ncbi:MAG TPA: histidinol-phosphatase HisJ family protein [Planctomycetota bacterium]|nr:histidinol-phosphatase HisJ family protein [Planctomycetota bacterium]
MIVDYHMHTPLCRHAVGEPEAYARRALDLGIEEIGFSDHSPMPTTYDPDWRMTSEEYPTYIDMVRRCQKAFPQLSIKLGLEADYHPGTEDFVRGVIAAHPFDYVIGSIHYLGDWGFDNPDHAAGFEKRDLHGIYAQYYDLVVRLAGTRMYDILGHPDVIKKFGHRPTRDYEPLERRALEAVAGAGMALDVNTSGLARPAKEIYPSLRMLKSARSMGIEITFGSDAHDPKRVGDSFAQAVALAKDAGYSQFRRYAGRRFELVRLP